MCTLLHMSECLLSDAETAQLLREFQEREVNSVCTLSHLP